MTQVEALRPIKPFLSYNVERYADCAQVEVVRITFTETGYRREVLSQYETLSNGATASAKREMRKLEREGALS